MNKLKNIIINVIENFKFPLIFSSLLTILLLILNKDMSNIMFYLMLLIINGVWIACIIYIIIKYFKKQ